VNEATKDALLACCPLPPAGKKEEGKRLREFVEAAYK
jgi:hypothetical protein